MPPPTIRLRITNGRNEPLALGLEPLGYWDDLAPGASRYVTYSLTDGPHLEIVVDADSIGIWDESAAAGNGLVFEDTGHYGSP